MKVEDTIRDFWATRPYRAVGNRKIAGVAAGIGRRYDIDPLLVRVAFVVAIFFSGVGLLLYLLGWLLLPEQPDESSALESLFGNGHSSVSPALTILLSLAMIPAALVTLGGSPVGLIGLALAGAAVFLLHRQRAGLWQSPQNAPVPGAPPGGGDSGGTGDTSGGPRPAPRPPPRPVPRPVTRPVPGTRPGRTGIRWASRRSPGTCRSHHRRRRRHPAVPGPG